MRKCDSLPPCCFSFLCCHHKNRRLKKPLRGRNVSHQFLVFVWYHKKCLSILLQWCLFQYTKAIELTEMDVFLETTIATWLQEPKDAWHDFFMETHCFRRKNFSMFCLDARVCEVFAVLLPLPVSGVAWLAELLTEGWITAESCCACRSWAKWKSLCSGKSQARMRDPHLSQVTRSSLWETPEFVWFPHSGWAEHDRWLMSVARADGRVLGEQNTASCTGKGTSVLAGQNCPAPLVSMVTPSARWLSRPWPVEVEGDFLPDWRPCPWSKTSTEWDLLEDGWVHRRFLVGASASVARATPLSSAPSSFLEVVAWLFIWAGRGCKKLVIFALRLAALREMNWLTAIPIFTTGGLLNARQQQKQTH